MKLNRYIVFILASLMGVKTSLSLGQNLQITDLPSQKSWLLAENTKKDNEINAFDPFADYSEFENTAEEQENINFFQTGRFLTLGALGGVKLFTLNLANLYQIGPAYGGYLNYFFDLNFAIQFHITASTHNIVFEAAGQPFLGGADFISMGVDFKFFIDKNVFNKHFSWLQPYLFLGVLYSSKTIFATFTNQSGYYSDRGYGVNIGLGTEFQFLRKLYFGLQYAFKFVTLSEEAVPIVLDTGTTTINTNFRPYGDWMNITVLLGVIF